MTQRGNLAGWQGVSVAMENSFRALGRSFSLIAALLVLGCATPAASPTPLPTESPNPSAPAAPTPTPGPTLPPITEVGSPAQAAALVFASQHIGRMGPLLPDVIGQSAWYEASREADGFGVKVTVGAGDCQAGCIERHNWIYHVDYDGTVTLVDDEGDDIGLPPADGTADPVTLRVILTAGPVCPVERNPPDPACAPRPVVNVEIAVLDTGGNQVASAVSGDDGVAVTQLPAGAYFVLVPPVEGLFNKAAELAFAAVGGDTVGLPFSYDTGIR